MQPPIPLTRRLGAVVELFRPELPAAAGVCVLLGELMALGGLPPLPVLVLGFVCGFFLSASALITNDYFDFEVDAVNAPTRPIPSGRLTRRAVMAIGLAAGLAGLIAALALNPAALLFSLPVWALGFVYNWKLKSAGLWGNLSVAASVAATFVLGGLAAGRPADRAVWVFGALVFCFDLAEEIAGDAMDAEGDRRRGSRSIAILWGRAAALRVSGALLGSVIGLTVLLILWGDWSPRYTLILPLIDLSIVFFGIRLLRSQTPAAGRSAMRGLYLSGSLGLLAFLIASVVHLP